MSGGTIIEIRKLPDRWRLWCAELPQGASGPMDECAVYCGIADEMPEVGDTVWWQGASVLWTPKDRRFIDKKLVKIGYSTSEGLADAN